MSKIDLHIHSIVSADGEFTPEQIVMRAKKLGIEVIAIADHDSVSAIDEAIKFAKENEITCIPASEMSTVLSDGTICHIVAYNIDPHHPSFIEREKQIVKVNKDAGDIVLQAAKEAGFKFEDEEVYKRSVNGYIVEEMIGEAILEDYRNDNDVRLKEFRPGGKFYENAGFNFFRQFYCQGCECYREIPDMSLPISEVARLCKQAGGFLSLAHPGHNLKKDLKKLDEVLSYGIKGIEVYSSYHTEDDVAFWHEQALAHDLICTVGSDFHGLCKPTIELGSVQCDEQEVLQGLKRYINF